MTEWISVKDLLPESREDVLCVAFWHEKYQTQIGWYSSINNIWHIITPAGDKSEIEVSHWMPLPEPPKQK